LKIGCIHAAGKIIIFRTVKSKEKIYWDKKMLEIGFQEELQSKHTRYNGVSITKEEMKKQTLTLDKQYNHLHLCYLTVFTSNAFAHFSDRSAYDFV